MTKKQKEITVQTQKGPLFGFIEIRMDIRSEPKTFHNRSTHDEETKLIGVHKVVAIVDGQEVPSLASEEFSGKDNILFHASAVEKALANYLKSKGDSKYESLDDRLKQNGYV